MEAKTLIQIGRAISVKTKEKTRIAPEAKLRRKKSLSLLVSCLKAMLGRRLWLQMEARMIAVSATLMAACRVIREEDELDEPKATPYVAAYSTKTR